MFKRTLTKPANFRGNPHCQSYKTTLNSSTVKNVFIFNWDGKLNHLSVFGWAMLFSCPVFLRASRIEDTEPWKTKNKSMKDSGYRAVRYEEQEHEGFRIPSRESWRTRAWRIHNTEPWEMKNKNMKDSGYGAVRYEEQEHEGFRIPSREIWRRRRAWRIQDTEPWEMKNKNMKDSQYGAVRDEEQEHEGFTIHEDCCTVL